MNPYTTDPPPQPAKPKKSSSTGCILGCVGTLIGVPLILFCVGYFVLFHTSLPVNLLVDAATNNIESEGRPVEFQGVSGTLGSGISVEEITIKGETEDSLIQGLKFKFNGILDTIFNNRLVIEELSVQKADFVVGPDFFERSDSDGDDESDIEISESDYQDEGGLFEIRKLNLANIRFRTADGETDFSIPLIRLEGLKLEDDNFDLAEFEVVSDALSAELAKATTREIDGKTIPFAYRIEGRLFPSVSPQISSEIVFAFDFAAKDNELTMLLSVFDGALQILPDETTWMQLNNLSLGNYFDSDAYIQPERFTITGRQKDDITQFEEGEFYLGQTRFEVAAQEIKEQDPGAAVVGTATVGGSKVSVRLLQNTENVLPVFLIELESNPKMEVPELISQIYYKRSYGELLPDEKTRVDGFAESIGK